MHFHVFCRVIDNLGDAGVSWRLAQRLDALGHSVTLIIDAPELIEQLAPGPRSAARAVSVVAWAQALSLPQADVVIEAFACDLPTPYVLNMAQAARARRPPVWINLEYLSAEPWVEGHHGLASRHPQLPLQKYFFFPGFTAKTGGLLKGFWATATAGNTRLADRPGAAPGAHTPQPVRLFVFAYDTPAVQALIAPLAALQHAVDLSIAPGALAPRVQKALASGSGLLRITYLDFCPQAQFDAVLAHQDLNIVRGEDSFVRAQLAAVPMLWHIYEQADAAHLHKLHAWLDRYLAQAPSEVAHVVRALSALMNPAKGSPPIGPAAVSALWARALAVLPAWQRHAQAWALALSNGPIAPPELGESLVTFVATKLQ